MKISARFQFGSIPTGENIPSARPRYSKYEQTVKAMALDRWKQCVGGIDRGIAGRSGTSTTRNSVYSTGVDSTYQADDF
jgi:hypothetical protein